ncbi:hypothetical protein GCM10009687_12760 [Asanoa iriomotensis]
MAQPAQAAYRTFYVEYRHGGGTGAIAVATRGSFYWTARSVVIVDPELYVLNGHCGLAYYLGVHSWNVDTGYNVGPICNTTGVNQYFKIGGAVLDGSKYDYPGIWELDIKVTDHTHNAPSQWSYYYKHS